MLKTMLMPVVLWLGLALPYANAQEPAQSEDPPAPALNPFDPSTWVQGGQAGTANPFDPAAWFATAPAGAPVQNWADPTAWMAAGHATMPLNLAHPAGWAAFINPYTHTGVHTALMNPATYAQFMQPQYWMQFMDANNWLAWFNPASYTTFMNPATYMGWMNPAAYAHVMHPAMYMQPMNPANYMPFFNPMTYLSWMNPGAYTIPGGSAGAAVPNWFDPQAWGQYAPPQPPQSEAQPPAGGEKTQ